MDLRGYELATLAAAERGGGLDVLLARARRDRARRFGEPVRDIVVERSPASDMGYALT
jgi:hypothetical protein